MTNNFHDIELEKGLLGYLMYNPTSFSIVKPIIENLDYFTAPAHRHIYAAMLDLDSAGNKKWDEMTIGNELKRNKKLTGVGGYGYLAQLIESAPAGGNMAYYSKILREDFLAGKAQRLAKELMLKIMDTEKPVLETVAESIGKLQSLQAALGAGKNKVRSVAEIVPQVFRDTEDALKSGVNPSLSTGISGLDTIYGGGLHRAEFNIVAGRPSLGKTAFALHVANSCSPVAKILFISLETTGESISRDRLIPMVSSIESTAMRMPERLQSGDWEKLAGAADRFAAYTNFRICDQSAMKIGDIELLVAEEAKAEGGGIDLLMLDYFQLIRLESGKSKRWEQFTEVSNRLKALIKEHNLFSIILCQLNREVEKQKRRPIISDLGESGRLEQDADTIALLHRKTDDSPLTYILAKNKNGPTGEEQLAFNKKFARFECAENGGF